MSSRPAQRSDATGYARQVHRALSDLPADTLEELLDELDDHLAEFAAEHDGSLEALGTPAAYAHELRTAAGLPPRVSSPRPGGKGLDDQVHHAMVRLSRHDAVRPLLAFLPELRPAWWVLRAWLTVLALDYLLLGSQHLAFPLPGGGGLGAVLALPLLAAAVALSVRLGQRAASQPHTDARRRTLSIAGNTLAGLLAVVTLVAVQQRSSQPVYADDGSYYPPAPVSGGMTHQDGTPITNIYPYSSTGQPLTDVLLYDQDGRALDDLSTQTHDGRQISRAVPDGTPPPPANAYPQQQQLLDLDGTPLDPTTPPATAPPATAPAATATPADPAPADPAPADPAPAEPTPIPTFDTRPPGSRSTSSPTAASSPTPGVKGAVPPTS